MAGIPDADQAIVEDRKVIHYLLSGNHPAGRAKAVFFRNFGSGSCLAEFARFAPRSCAFGSSHFGRRHAIRKEVYG
jgi:hypothetical protein